MSPRKREAASGNGATPLWQQNLFALLHPVQIAVVEAALWIDEPLSVRVLVDVFDHRYPLNNLSYHVRKLVEVGVLHEVHGIPRRGALEHFHRLNT